MIIFNNILKMFHDLLNVQVGLVRGVHTITHCVHGMLLAAAALPCEY